MTTSIFNFKEIDLTVQKFVSAMTFQDDEVINTSSLDLQHLLEYGTNKLFLRLKASVLTGPEKELRQVVKTTVQIPKNWFEHLKQDLNISWVLKLSPVKYTEKDFYQEVHIKVAPTFPEYKGTLDKLGPPHLKILVLDQESKLHR